MLTQVSSCQKDAIFLATLGQLLNVQGRYLDAADHLERALMLEPELKDAQLSYAIALTGSGDLLSASELLANLLADPTLPEHLRPSIVQQKAALTSLANSGTWQRRFTVATRLGYDSNLLGSPNLSSLALTLAGQTQVLQLQDSYLARSGSYARVDAQLNLQHTQPNGTQWDAVANIRTRQSSNEPSAGAMQTDLLLERNRYIKSGAYGHYLNLTASNQQSNAATYFQSWGAAGGWVGAWPGSSQNNEKNCYVRMGGEWQLRTYLDNPLLSGRYTGIAINGSCRYQTGFHWLIGLKAGQDSVIDAARPGGNQDQLSLRMAAYLPLARLAARAAPAWAAVRGGGILLDYEHIRQKDDSGYSAILDNGSTRIIRRQAMRMEYQYTLNHRVQWLLGAERVGQTSNIALFQMDNSGAYCGLRVNW